MPFLTKYMLTKNPAKASKKLLAIGWTLVEIGLKKQLIIKLIQKLEHSWHRSGFLIYGTLATKFLSGAVALVSLQA